MKNEQKGKPSKDGQSSNKILTAKERKLCEEFAEYRHRYGMNQKDWAKAVGISYGLVKRIENQTITCSKRTLDRIQNFVASREFCSDSHDIHSLEEHVLYDIFITNMGQLTKKEAATYAGECTHLLRDTLSWASRCSSPDAQKRYFEMINMLFKVLRTAAYDSLEGINKGIDVSVIEDSLTAHTKKLIAQTAPPRETSMAMGNDKPVQMNLMDLEPNGNNM